MHEGINIERFLISNPCVKSELRSSLIWSIFSESCLISSIIHLCEFRINNNNLIIYIRCCSHIWKLMSEVEYKLIIINKRRFPVHNGSFTKSIISECRISYLYISSFISAYVSIINIGISHIINWRCSIHVYIICFNINQWLISL